MQDNRLLLASQKIHKIGIFQAECEPIDTEVPISVEKVVHTVSLAVVMTL